MIDGTPFSGTFVLDGNGRATCRYFKEFPRERASTATVMRESFTWMTEAVIEAAPEIAEQFADVEALTLSGTLEYRACNDSICYLPVSVPRSFAFEFQHLDNQRSRQRW